MNRLARYLMPFAVAAMLGGCGVKESFKDASGDVAQFHTLLDRGDWQQVWKSGDPELRRRTDRDTFASLFGAVHSKLGTVRTSKQTGWNVDATTGGTYLTLTMQTKFEKGSGTEQFVYRKGDGGALSLVSYQIDSQDMMFN